ncbi:MAG: hypothetical protein A4E37_00527 [Methanoregulaceae archaeon PtaB.Bin056]|jgi:hypothetical protein|nr:MAG: hypothetical protein A4E37_00527 [Methanoregulaceae archaeon PtaB.Bin056]
MTVYETPDATEGKHSFLDGIKEIPGYIDQRLPTLDKDFDLYFEENLPAIIEEWGLLSSVHLTQLERRITRIHQQVDYLEKERATLEERAARLDRELKILEGL